MRIKKEIEMLMKIKLLRTSTEIEKPYNYGAVIYDSTLALSL